MTSPGIVLGALFIIAILVLFVPSSASGHGPGHIVSGLMAPDVGPALVRASDGVVTIPGNATSLPVEVSGVQQLGAATITLDYDPDVLHPTSCQRNPLFEVGLCNLDLDRDSNGVADAVRFNVVSLDGVDVPASTPLMLVEISWQGVSMPGSGNESVIEVQVETFTDVDALPLDFTAQNGVITLIPVLTPTPTPTPPASAGQTIHLPLMTFATGGPPPAFQCGGWCMVGSAPDLRRQSVTSDKAVGDWRMRIDGQIQESLVKETTFSALAEAPTGATIYIEAMWQGQWLLACKSMVICTQAEVISNNEHVFSFASLLMKEN